MKRITHIILMVCLCNIAFAQSEISNPTSDMVSWGVKAGLNYSNLYGKEIDYIFANDQTECQSGFHVGIYVDTRMSENFGLKHELLFSQRRVGVSVTEIVNGDYSSKLTMSYLDLMPASLIFQAGGFQLYTGPYASTLLNANVQRKDENGRIFRDKSIFGDPENDETETRYLQKLDFGANVGVEYRFVGLSIGARYMHGFTDIFQYANSYTNGDTKTDGIKIYNSGLMVSIGYVFK